YNSFGVTKSSMPSDTELAPFDRALNAIIWQYLKLKNPVNLMFTGFWWNLVHSQRRKRDSNPRRCDPQQFSRLPQSTTLPFLQIVFAFALWRACPPKHPWDAKAGANIETFFYFLKRFCFFISWPLCSATALFLCPY